MKPMLLFLLSNIMFFTMFAQKGNVEQKEAMKKLQWMTGDWSGSSTVAVNGQKLLTNIRESIVPGLDGTILLINVWATDKDTNTNRQSLAYTAFSVISYDVKNHKYRWNTWRNSGDAYDEHPFKVGDQSFEYVADENGGQVRYKASLGSNGEFLETGEYSEDGTAWGEFITMKLFKKRGR